MEDQEVSSTSNKAFDEYSPAFDQYLDDVFKALVDPISLELMVEPVMTADNMTYERETIEQWFTYCEQHGREYSSPVTNQSLSSKDLRPNIVMKSIVAATIKYLEAKDADGSLEGKPKNMLTRYKEFEKEKMEKLAREQELEQRYRSLTVCCKRHHNMVFMRQNRFPSQYVTRYRQLNITCDLCHTQMIHSFPHNFYFNCASCNFDVCDTCIGSNDYQERINNSHNLNPSELLTGVDDMDDLQRLEELLRLVMQVPRGELTGNQPRIAAGAAAPALAVVPPNPSQERPSRMSRFMNMFRNPFRGNENERHDIHLCLRGHAMASYVNVCPPRYTSATCDVCALPALENTGQEFFHCSRCRYDVCHNCMLIRQANERNQR
jgi:hypothetical protein